MKLVLSNNLFSPLKLLFSVVLTVFTLFTYGQKHQEINQSLQQLDGEKTLFLINEIEQQNELSELLQLKKAFSFLLLADEGYIPIIQQFNDDSFDSQSEAYFLYNYIMSIHLLQSNKKSSEFAHYIFKTLKCIKTSTELPTYATRKEFNCYNNLSYIFHETGDDKTSEKYLKLAYDKAVEFKDSLNISLTSNNLGIIFKNQGNYDQAFFRYQEALSISRALGDDVGIIKALNNLGILQETANNDRGNYSYNLYKRAQEIADKNDLTNINSPIPYLKEGKFELALSQYQSKLLTALETSDLVRAKSAVLGIANCYDSLEMYKDSKEAYQLYLTFENELQQELINEKTKEIESRYQLFEKETKINQLEKDKELQLAKERESGLIFWLIIIFISLTLVISLLLFQKRLLTATIKQEQTENQLLRSQMNPHFIFNTLSVIQSLIQTEKYDKAVTSIGKFAKLNRNILNHSKQKLIPLREEIESLVDYLDLQRMRFSDQITYDIKTSDLNLDLLKIPPNLIQPLIENSIKHGILPSKNKGEISISFNSNEKTLICVVQDNGIGYLNSKQLTPNEPNRESFGISILKGRLSFLEKTYKQETSFHIEELTENGNAIGTKAILTLPIIQENA